MAEIVNLMDLQPGHRIATADGAVAEVVDNPRDGVWVVARYLEAPDEPELVGTEEMIFAQDIAQILHSPEA